MAESSGTRSVMPHPPAGVPKYFDSSPYDGAQIAGYGGPKSQCLALYDELAKSHFVQVPETVTDAQLAWLEGFQHERVVAEREERRMHFGAFCLVSLLFFLLLPTMVTTQFVLALALLEVLLLVLIVPYVFVYFGYENRVRAMTLGLFRLREAHALRAERALATAPAANAPAKQTSA